MCETVRRGEFRISLKRQRESGTHFYLAVYLNFAKIRVDNLVDSETFFYFSVDKTVQSEYRKAQVSIKLHIF